VAITVRDSHDAQTLVAWWVGAIVMLVLAVPLGYAYVAVGFAPGAKWIFYPLIALLLLGAPIVLYKAARATLEYLRFDRAGLAGGELVDRLGGELAALLPLPSGAAQASAELVCIELGRPQDDLPPARTLARVRVGGFQGRIVWSSGVVRVPAGAMIRIPIPAGLPAWDMPAAGEAVRGRLYHAWELRVDVSRPGLDVARTFNIEVAKKS